MSTLRQQKRGKPAGKGSHSLLKGPKVAGEKKGKGGKLTSTKNKIRGVERLLRKAGSDNKLKRNLETKLLELKGSLSKHNKEELERKFAVRYHKIRFFERVKLERRVKQLEGKEKRGHALSDAELDQIQKSRQALQYVLDFPKGERYVSILKEAADPEAQASLDAERTRLKSVIRHQLAEDAMLADADEGLGQAALPAGAQSDAEGDAFFLESDTEQSLDDAPQAMAAANLLAHSTSICVDAADTTAQQNAAQLHQAAPSNSNVLEPPPGKRQALSGGTQHDGPAAKRAKLRSHAGAKKLGKDQQGAPLEDQKGSLPHQDAFAQARHSLAQPQNLSAIKAMPSGNPLGSPGGQQNTMSRGAVPNAKEAARAQKERSAASRSQTLLRQLEQKYAQSKQHFSSDNAKSRPKPQLRPDRAKPGSNQQPRPVNAKAERPFAVMHPLHAARQHLKLGASVQRNNTMKKVSSQVPPVHKGVAIADRHHSESGNKAAATLPMRTRAEGGRKRRK